MAAAAPALATVVDFGDTWRKAAGLGGSDLRAICLSKIQPGDCALSPSAAKPRFLLLGAVHARELSTAELAYRWIDHLVSRYGTDADVIWLMDNTEMWVVPVLNADGREIVEQGGNAP